MRRIAGNLRAAGELGRLRMFQSWEGRVVPWDLLVKDVPPELHHDLDYIISMLRLGFERRSEFAKNRLYIRFL
jgi:hypothetical protein